MFGLTTHDKANDVLLDKCERRAEILIPFETSSFMEASEESDDENISASRLTIKLAPGVNLRETPRMKSTSSLLVDFSGKSKFLQNLSMHPQHSSGKHKGNVKPILLFF